MLFPTASFGLFFAVTMPLSWALRGRNTVWRWSMLGVSWLFYAGWDPRFVVLLALSMILNHTLVHRIDRLHASSARAVLLAATVALNLSLLATFKYADLALRTMERLAQGVGLPVQLPLLELPLPVGVSFFTFEAISYAVDVYRGVSRPVPMVDFGLYLSWFPHLVAGPLVRVRELVPQLHRSRPEVVQLAEAMRLILGGLVLKVLVADTLASRLVDPVFERPDLYSATTVLFAIYGYAAQILCDFSAYTDMAQGTSLLLGIRLPDNFRQPYRAWSLRDFWRRWHITLSRWLRDYLYIPLGGSRYGSLQTTMALLITMLLGGLWHGAAWRYVAWGGIHGVLLVAERFLGLHRAPRSSLARVVRSLITFQVVAFAWVPFRSPSLAHAGTLLGRLGTAEGTVIPVGPALALAMLIPIVSQLAPAASPKRVDAWLGCRSPWVLAGMAALALVVIDTLGPEGVAAFLYYQF
ncbi:MAG: hypothetical protein CL927_07830 [Deltaproteobacteria bacterium]|nr:hypothetical protein [Deltaproteobacteria bacterium]